MSDERYRAIFSQAAVGIAVAGLDNRFVEANQKFADILGYSVDELRTLTFAELTHPEDLAQTLVQVDRLLAGDVPHYSLEKRYLRKDGATVWSQTTVTLLRDATGEAHSFIGIIEDITDRKRAEAAMRDASQRLQIALGAGDLGDWYWDAKTDLVSFSKRAATIFGLPPESTFTWAQMHATLPGEEGERTRIAREQAIADRSDYTIEYCFVRTSGQRCWVAARGRAVFGPAGAVSGMTGVVQDITERVHAEDSSRRLAAVVESSDDAIISKTLDGTITTWNDSATRIFGYAAEEVIGKPVTVLIPPHHRDEEPAILQRLRRGERIEHYETVRMRKDGSLLDVSLTVSPIKGLNGAIVGASKIVRDITQRKHAEEALRAETRILELLNATGVAIAAHLDLQTLVQNVADSTTQLSGAKYGAFVYNVVDQASESFWLYALSGARPEEFAGFGLPRNVPLFSPTFRGEGVVRSADITKDPRCLDSGTPKANLRICSYLAAPVVSRSGEVIGGLFLGHPDVNVFTERAERLVVGVAAQAAVAMDNARLYEAAQREIVSRQSAEAALREVDRRKDEFLATLAHELRNPLAPIRQAALIAKTPSATEAQKRWSHDVISRQVQYMALLLDDLLDISRITRGTLKLRTEMTDLNAIIEAAVETARPTIDAKRHQLSIETPPQPLHFAADPLRLSQVLSNLLTNAAKYTDPEGQIRLRASCADQHITMSVTDTGIGIPPDALNKVFAMFSQVKSAQDRSDGGLGIGLALANGLVKLHGGTIHVTSEGTGRGSEFVVRLPLRTLRAPRQADTIGTTAVNPVRPRRILIADDNEDAAESLAMLLRIDGHAVTVAHDGKQALIAFNSVQPEVALLDIGMPELNGYEVARQVRQGPLSQSVTLIAVTGWGQDNDKARALTAGFNHHFTKPIDPEQLSNLLREGSG